jgi:hypothetical protein
MMALPQIVQPCQPITTRSRPFVGPTDYEPLSALLPSRVQGRQESQAIKLLDTKYAGSGGELRKTVDRYHAG